MNELQLLSGVDIPFVEAQIILHQPTIKEISYIGEDKFFIGCELLKFSKDILNIEDKTNLENYSDFDIFMSILENKNTDSAIKENIENALLVLSLLFPTYKIEIRDRAIVFIDDNGNKGSINNQNFEIFKNLLISIFDLHESIDTSDFNPSGALAQKIADKLKKRHQKLAEQKGDGQKITVFGRYISILAVGEHKDINSLMNYTVYQLMDEFRRFGLKEGYDKFFSAKLAGAKDIKEPEDWMKDIHSKDSKNEL